MDQRAMKRKGNNPEKKDRPKWRKKAMEPNPAKAAISPAKNRLKPAKEKKAKKREKEKRRKASNLERAMGRRRIPRLWRQGKKARDRVNRDRSYRRTASPAKACPERRKKRMAKLSRRMVHPPDKSRDKVKAKAKGKENKRPPMGRKLKEKDRDKANPKAEAKGTPSKRPMMARRVPVDKDNTKPGVTEEAGLEVAMAVGSMMTLRSL
jgi:hypothetical protein